MNMDDLIEQLDEVLDGGFKMPGKRVVVDVERVRAVVASKGYRSRQSGYYQQRKA